MKNVAVVGASGAVGKELLTLLEERNFPIRKLRCFASEKSHGNTVIYKSRSIPLEVLQKSSFHDLDLAFFCTNTAISKEWAPKMSCTVIDLSSAFRQEAPLVIPEINPYALKKHQGIIASPNCAATILLMPLYPLHRLFRAKRVIVSTYQAASGGGALLMEELKKETKAVLENRSHKSLLPYPYAFNVFPHDSPLLSSGYVEEEHKISEETKKILELPSLRVSATCIRVPVLRAHSLTANVEFENPPDLEIIYQEMAQTPGLKLFENKLQNRFATPLDASYQDEILCGRFRIDPTDPHVLEFWAVGDQLRKGAALNAVQIAEHLYSDLSVRP